MSDQALASLQIALRMTKCVMDCGLCGDLLPERES